MDNLKAHYRTRFLSQRRALSGDAVAVRSAAATDQVIRSALFKESAAVVLYCAVDNEVLTEPLRRVAHSDGKAVYFPRPTARAQESLEFVRVGSEEVLPPGRWGIGEPSGSEVLQVATPDPPLVVIPGVAFDVKGTRLGKGGGYYDRALRVLGNRGTFLGLAYSFQLVPSLPRASHDQPMSFVAIETELLRFSNNDSPATLVAGDATTE